MRLIDPDDLWRFNPFYEWPVAILDDGTYVTQPSGSVATIRATEHALRGSRGRGCRREPIGRHQLAPRPPGRLRAQRLLRESGSTEADADVVMFL